METLLAVHKKFHTVVVGAFKNDNGFVAALDKACREFVNKNAVCVKTSSKSPELLARFCDNLLKKSAKNPEEGELEETLKSVMTVFKYVEDKDVFQRFYSKMLAKRLINDASASEDAEESMITKLKVCPLPSSLLFVVAAIIVGCICPNFGCALGFWVLGGEAREAGLATLSFLSSKTAVKGDTDPLPPLFRGAFRSRFERLKVTVTQTMAGKHILRLHFFFFFFFF